MSTGYPVALENVLRRFSVNPEASPATMVFDAEVFRRNWNPEIYWLNHRFEVGNHLFSPPDIF